MRSLNNWRRVIYPLMAVLIVVVFGLSMYEDYVLNAGPDVSGYMGVPADPGDLPPADYKGAYLLLQPGANSRFPSNLVQLLETDTPGVITTTQVLQIDAKAVAAVLINQTSIDFDVSEYRVYAVAKEPQETTAVREGGGTVLKITPKEGLWAPGSYIVDVPSGGMFDTSRVYYAFNVK